MSGTVLDASALLAYLRDEPGADVVVQAIADGTTVSTVNLSEVLSNAASRGADPAQLAAELASAGLLGGAIAVEPFTAVDSVEAARLRPITRAVGLSLGDRSCLALAHRLEAIAVTADGTWGDVEVGVEIRPIR